MQPPMQLPLRVLIKGPSTMVYTSMMGGPRTDMVFSRVMEQRLLAGGRPVEMRNTGALGWPTSHLFRTWDADVVEYSPDIVILAPHWETVHVILPRWLERLANTENRRPGFLRTLYYRKFGRGLGRIVLLVQRAIDRPSVLLKRRIGRAMADTAEYIRLTQRFGSPLVLVMELHTPAGVKLRWYGGFAARAAYLNERMRELVAKIDRPDVQFVEIMDLMDKFPGATHEELWRDGIHFGPEFHRAIGERFADIAEEWAATQVHLAKP